MCSIYLLEPVLSPTFGNPMRHLEHLGYGDGPIMLTLIVANVASNISWKNALEFPLDYVFDSLGVHLF